MNENNNIICDFGLHIGEPYTTLPASFLHWMIANNHKNSAIAKDELTRREEAVFHNRRCEKV